MNNVCIIPARGGSKRIPKKNIRDFLGKPIIAYSIETALNCGLFDEVMVSTDSEQIAEVAESYGAKVPFIRSDENSADEATTASVLTEVIKLYKNEGQEFNFACCLYPAAPFVTSKILIEAYEMLREKGFDAIFPLVRFPTPIQKSYKLVGGKVEMNWPEYRNTRTQDLAPAFHDSGQFYWFGIPRYLELGDVMSDNCGGIEVSEIETQDIDNEADWLLAEMKHGLLKN
jgi:pseudaminic acid cytidylyltransferase